MLKSLVKKIMFGHPVLEKSYIGLRANFHRTKKLSVFWYDLHQTYRDMHWGGNEKDPYAALSAELLFQYHKLEKGLCMPGEKRFFGYDPAAATLSLLKKWRENGYEINDPIYAGAVETLRAYRKRLDETPPLNGTKLLTDLDAELSVSDPVAGYEPVIADYNILQEGDVAAFDRILKSRRSVREFKDKPVSMDTIQQACTMAAATPSACNRQPCKVYVVSDDARRSQLLSLQNGNRGFGHTAQAILIMTASANCFFDAYERHEPYVNGGLFSMSLMLALQVHGVSSCCLNWSVPPMNDKIAHQQFDIPDSERITMLLAIGYMADDVVVPYSPRRSIESMIFSR